MNMKLIVFFAVIAAVYSAPAELEIKKPEVPELVKDAITEMKTEELNRDKRTLLAAVPSIAPITPIVTSAIAPITARFYTEPAVIPTIDPIVNTYARTILSPSLAYSGFVSPYSYYW